MILRSVSLPLSHVDWIYTGGVPLESSFEEIYGELLSRFGSGFLIRGCSPEIADFLGRSGCEAVVTGSEAVIDIGGWRPGASLGELSRRGLKPGRVKEIAYSQENMKRLEALRTRTPYGGKPFLKYLFRTGYDEDMRCFVHADEDGGWLGAVTVSRTGPDSAHVEAMLRSARSPVGVMESLFVYVIRALGGDGYRELSLGEVPFVRPPGLTVEAAGMQSLKERFLFGSGHFLRFAYNYKSLFRFKDKFNPAWRPVYMCGSRSVPFRALADVFIKTGYCSLSGSELVSGLKSLASSPFKKRP
ncbi:MAG TPA: phosphatidylglycerol lysyltransferase domain-containing protein [Thermodesulfobacteriota bacterium]|nr:phosphatidylglycerol lysyltransferase domain-containing protein [Thermodesulfobacteriota bacterium]